MRRLLTLVLIFTLLASCGDKESAEVPATQWPSDVVRLKITKEGAVFANDRKVTLDELSVVLKDAATQKHRVWYYREAADEKAPPVADKVIKLVIENGLRIKLSATPDYSDHVDEEGRSTPDK